MPEQRLKELVTNRTPEYVKGCPLLLEANALYLDNVTNNCIAQLKWKNLSADTMRAVLIEIVGEDAFGQKLTPIQYQYSDLGVAKGTVFGSKTPIIIRANKTVGYTVRVKAVSYANGRVWRPEEGQETFRPLPPSRRQTAEGELLQQLKSELADAGYKNSYTFCAQNAEGLWQCGCGSWQLADSPCLDCGASRKDIFRISDVNLLKQHLAEKKEEAEKERIEAEKQAEAEQKEKSFNEIFRAANYLLSVLNPAYEDAVRIKNESLNSKIGKKTKVMNVLPLFNMLSEKMKSPVSVVAENLSMAFMVDDVYTGMVKEAYDLLRQLVDYHTADSLVFINNNANVEQKMDRKEYDSTSKKYSSLITKVKESTEEML